MTEPTDARREDYWDTLDQEDGEDGEEDRETVKDLLLDQLDPDTLHGIALTAQNGSTYYMVVVMSSTTDGGPALNLTTVVVDLKAETVKIHEGNSMWVPKQPSVAEGLTGLLGRATTDLSTGSTEGSPPAVRSAVDTDLSEVLDQPVRDSGAPEDSGSGSGSDHDHIYPEIEILEERLRKAGISEKRFNNLEFGSKEPWDHDMRRSANIMGNYGVYVKKDDPLVLVDIDYPAEAPDLPETLTVSSPHGSEERAHHFYRVKDLEKLHETFGKWNFKPSWGDIRIHNQYVVGPGSQLDAEGCDTGDFSKGDPDGCPECSDPSGGFYDLVANRPIEDLPVEDLIQLVEEDPQAVSAESGSAGREEVSAPEGSEDPAEPDETHEESESDETEGSVECHRCERTLKQSEAALLASDGDREVWACEGGCPQ